MRAWRKFISAGGLELIMLSLVEVSAGYSSLRALFGVSLEVAAGETVGVIGPNGAGKRRRQDHADAGHIGTRRRLRRRHHP